MRVALFYTCLVDAMRPSVGVAAIELLEAAGCSVAIPEQQTCCGQPAWNAGDPGAAMALARKTIAEFEGYDYVVAPSGSCADHIRNQYPSVLADDEVWRQRALALAARVFELSDFLVSVCRFSSPPGRFDGTVAYHDSCTGLRGLGIKAQPRALLGAVAGLRLKEMAGAEDCCGFGGSFAVKFGEISAAIAEKKCRHIQASGVDAVVGGDVGCLLNIEGKLRRIGDTTTRVLHVAEVLAGADAVRRAVGEGD